MRRNWMNAGFLRLRLGLLHASLSPVVLLLLLAGCSSGDSESPSGASNPVPSITSISPTSVNAGGASFTLTVNGTNFVPASVVQWKGAIRTTTFVSSTQLAMTVTGADIASPGTAEVVVVNLAPGGGISNVATFTTSSGTPAIASLSPFTIAAGSAPFTLTVTGTSFVSSSIVRWNGSDRSTTFINNTQLAARIPVGDIASQGTAQVTVATPGPGGGASGAAPFAVTVAQSPVPAITSIAPTSVSTELTGFALTVNGTGLVAGSVAQWNGASRATLVRSSTQLLFAPLPADNAVTGSALVSVLNPSPGGLSGSLGVSVSPLAANVTGVTDRLSVAGDSAEANGGSYSGAVSADGRFVAFASNASNLVPYDTTGLSDTFLRDTCRGVAAGCTPSTVRISLASDGSQGDGWSSAPALSASGRFIAFTSTATNLSFGDNDAAEDIFLRDTCTGASGCTPSTVLVSVANDGSASSDMSWAPAISADGRVVAFLSSAATLVSGDTNRSYDVFVRDTCFGASSCLPTTARVSVADDGSEAGDDSFEPSISANGRLVSFLSGATNLVPGDTNNQGDIFIRDTCIAASGCTPSTNRASVDSAGTQGNAGSFLPRISGNGRHVVFTSWATNLVDNDSGNLHDVFVRDTCFGAVGACTPATSRASVASNGSQADAPSGGPATQGASISADGRFVAFGSRATNLVTADTNGMFDIFLRDTCAGTSSCTPATRRMSVSPSGTQSRAAERSDQPSISSDGRFIIFMSDSTMLLPGDSNSEVDIFLSRSGIP
jgi:Tol biopolymer transport system component